jgi:transcription antitermination factor NusG
MGRRVRITAGRFKGVEGVIKRIKKNKFFLIQIDGVAAVAITYVPADCLEPATSL